MYNNDKWERPVDHSKPVHLGKRSNDDRDTPQEAPSGPVKTPISEINDVNVLFKMMNATNSRGQKQRIQRRIAKLTGTKKEKKPKEDNSNNDQ